MKIEPEEYLDLIRRFEAIEAALDLLKPVKKKRVRKPENHNKYMEFEESVLPHLKAHPKKVVFAKEMAEKINKALGSNEYSSVTIGTMLSHFFPGQVWERNKKKCYRIDDSKLDEFLKGF